MNLSATRRSVLVGTTAAGTLAAVRAGQTTEPDPLPSWNDNGPRRAILNFVSRVSNGQDAIPVAERIGPGKPVGINQHLGRRPVFCAGNSDGDLQMLQWTTDAAGPGFGMLVHHTDGQREYAFDRQSPVGRLEKALAVASEAGWTVVDMRTDWRRVFPFQ